MPWMAHHQHLALLQPQGGMELPEAARSRDLLDHRLALEQPERPFFELKSIEIEAFGAFQGSKTNRNVVPSDVTDQVWSPFMAHQLEPDERFYIGNDIST